MTRLCFERLETRLMMSADGLCCGNLFERQGTRAARLAEGEASHPTSLGEYAQALADAGVSFSGPSTAGDVGRQRELFGADQDLLPFIEDESGELTWEFPDGTSVEGFQTLFALSQLSAVPLPPDVISIQTNAGRMEWLLLVDEAPNTVANFLRYVNGGVDGQGYTGSILHRSDANFVIQGGGYRPTSLTTTELSEIRGSFANGNFEHHIPEFDLIPDERGPDSPSNLFGTYAAAKGGAGAGSEYYFNLNDNSFLDAQGFTVFALDLDAHLPDGGPNPASTINLIDGLTRVDVDPSNDGTGGFSVFDNVPFTAHGEMIHIQSIDGSGTVTGTVFHDANRDSVADADESGIAGTLVFSDANGNGMRDEGERGTRTGKDGSYSLVLPAGDHSIRRQVDNALATLTVADTMTLRIGEVVGDRDFALASDWQNLSNPRDVSGDTFIVPADALIIINELNNPIYSLPSGKLPPRVESAPFLDVDGNAFVTALDALRIINFLNNSTAEAEGEATTNDSTAGAFQVVASSPRVADARVAKRKTADDEQNDERLAPRPADQHMLQRPTEPDRTPRSAGELEELLDALASDTADAWLALKWRESCCDV